MSAAEDAAAAAMLLQDARYEVMLRDPSYTTADGEPGIIDAALVGWSPIEVLPRDVCQHSETVCLDCASSWAQDHYVRVIDRFDRVLLVTHGAPIERA